MNTENINNTTMQEANQTNEANNIQPISIKNLDIKIPAGFETNWPIGNGYRKIKGNKNDKEPERW